MYARRFLIVVTILTLLVVAAAFAIFQFGGSVLIRQATPEGHYSPPPPGTGPDYRSHASWLTRPELFWPDNPAEWKPAGVPPPASGTRPASLFYIHPTTYFGRDRWNAPLQPAGAYSDLRTTLFLKTQASAFNDVAEVWAPRYRQAAYGAFLLRTEDAQKALDLAYGDVSAAFEQFLREVEPGRPIIVAGHSQGALHLMRLLQERNADIAGRLVGAYVVGWPISRTADLPALGYPACTMPAQAGCILSWLSFGDPANPSLILAEWQESRGPAGAERRREDILCTNPITGTMNGAAPPAANPGTLVPNGDMTNATLVTGLVGARCHGGLLVLEGEVPPLGPYVLPGNNYHVFDYALFWGAIRRDSQRRLAAWRR